MHCARPSLLRHFLAALGLLWAGAIAATPPPPPAIETIFQESARLGKTNLPEQIAYLEARLQHAGAYRPSDRVRLHLELANSQLARLEQAKAIATLKAALALSPKADAVDDIPRTQALKRLCESWIAAEQKRYTEAITLAQDSADFFAAAGEPKEHAYVLKELALMHNVVGAYEAAQLCLDQAVALYEAQGDHNAANHARLFSGQRVSAQGLEQWMNQVLQILRAFEAEGDRAGMASAYQLMGYDYVGDRQEAIRLFQESIKLSREAGYKHIEFAALTGLAAMQSRNKQATEAHQTILAAEKLIEHTDENFERSHFHRVAGSVYTALGGAENLAKAEAYIRQSLADYEKRGDMELLQVAKEALAKFELDHGDPRQALRHATEITNWFRAHSRHYLPVGLRLMIRAQLKLEDYRAAYATQLELTKVQEEKWQSGSAQQMEMRMKEFEIVNRQNEIKLLAQENELKRQEIVRFEEQQRQTRQLQLLGAAMLVIIIVLYLLVRIHRRSSLESRRAALALEAQNRELETANAHLKVLGEQQKKILRTAAHDLKNPIGAIKNCIELARDDLQSLPAGPATASIHELVGLMQQSAAYMQQLVGKTLDYHLSERLASTLTLRPVDVAALVTQMVTLNQSSAKRKQIAIHVALAPLPPAAADSHALREVFDNLLSNAVKYTPPGGTVTVTAAPAPDDPRRLDLVIADTGPGIPEPEQPRIFDPFNNVSSQPTGGESKNGLGLSIAKTLAESMGGTIRYRNHPAGGAEFTLSLRVADNPAPTV